MMRTMERTVTRAKLPLRYTQGFNPHPYVSLPCPRPVGVASLDDLLVVRLDGSPDEADMLGRLNENAPCGMRFLRAMRLGDKCSPQPRRIACELALPPGRAERVRARIAGLDRGAAWPVERTIKAARRGAPAPVRTIDLGPLIENLTMAGGMLRWDAVACEGLWARPGEVMKLLGLDERMDLAAVVRTNIEYDL